MAKILGRFDLTFALRIFFFFASSVCLLYCTSKHVPWRDEYQTFLVSTRTKTWAEFWTATRYERTPPLHYLFQSMAWPILNGWVEPRTFIRILTIPFSFLTFFLLFFRFRFNPFVALLLALNVYFFREWGVLSRSYAIGGALLLLSLDFRMRGKFGVARILLAFSGATHLLFFIVSGTLFTFDLFDFYRKEKRKNLKVWVPIFFSVLIFMVIAVHAIPPRDSVFAVAPAFPGISRVLGEGLRIFAVAFFPIESWDFKSIFSGGWTWNQSPLRFAWAFLFAVPLIIYFRKDRSFLIRLGLASLPILFLFTCAYGPALRHTGILFLLALYYMIQVEPARRNRIAEFAIVIGPFLTTLFWLASWNPVHPRFAFSDAPGLVPYFQKATTIYALRDYSLFPAMAESGRDLFDVQKDRTVSYPFFRTPKVSRSVDDFCRRLEHYPLKTGDLFVFPLNERQAADRLSDHCGIWSLVYESKGVFVTDETYVVYRYQGSGGG
jgi:hypothetical protein